MKVRPTRADIPEGPIDYEDAMDWFPGAFESDHIEVYGPDLDDIVVFRNTLWADNEGREWLAWDENLSSWEYPQCGERTPGDYYWDDETKRWKREWSR